MNSTGIEKSRVDDIYCRMLLSNLFDGYDHLPITRSSMSFFALAMITNDVLINGRKNILEFGSGLSTILLARLIKKNKLNCVIYSVEHDKSWFDLLNSILKKESTAEHVVSIHAPLSFSKKAKNKNEWYAEENITKYLTDDICFDLVVIDGPPAYEKNKSLSRYPALHFIKTRLNKSYSIYVDDASRPGEKTIINLWEEELNYKFNLINNRLALSSDNNFIQYSCLPC